MLKPLRPEYSAFSTILIYRPLRNVGISTVKENEAQNCVLSDFFIPGRGFIPPIFDLVSPFSKLSP